MLVVGLYSILPVKVNEFEDLCGETEKLFTHSFKMDVKVARELLNDSRFGRKCCGQSKIEEK